MHILSDDSPKEFAKIREWFPELKYYSQDKTIIGRMNIGPCRYVKKQNGIEWDIQPCNQSDPECILGSYLIKIDLKEIDISGNPKVYEIEGKIEQLAKELNKDIINLHVYPIDKSCCLGIFLRVKTFSEFIRDNVYPYFVWQSYYSIYKALPPCGEYSHGIEGIKEAIADRMERFEYIDSQIAGQVGRNEKCLCGSNKKYKKCCLDKDEEHKKEINVIQAEIYALDKFIKRQIVTPATNAHKVAVKNDTNEGEDNMHWYYYHSRNLLKIPSKIVECIERFRSSSIR